MSGAFDISGNALARKDGQPWQSLGFKVGQTVTIAGFGVRQITDFDNSPTYGPGTVLKFSGPSIDATGNAISIVALIVDLLAPTLGGQRDYVASLKLVAYAYTAVWIAGIFRLIPAVGGIIGLLAGIYSLYTFYLGAAPVKKCPAEKAVGYTIIVLICNIVLFWLLGLMVLPMMVGGGIAGLGTMGMMR